MTAVKGKGPVFDPGVCRCCGAMKKCRVLNVEYESFGKKELYSDMIMDCFGLLMSHLDGKPTERLICATCVTRIREALSFRRQVFRCEEAFLQLRMYEANTEKTSVVQPDDVLADNPPKIKIEVKTEPQFDGGSDSGSQYDDALADQIDSKADTMDNDSLSNEDLPLTHHINRAIKVPKRCDSAALAKDIMITRQRLDRHRSLQAARKAVVRRPELRTKQSSQLAKQLMNTKLPMSKVQQLMRERDPTYMTETNILTIVEFSYVCPFKCRHNNLLCYYCGDSHNNPQSLREHTSTHDPKRFKVTEHKNMIKLDLTRIDCRLCDEKIDDLDLFKKHVTSVHKKRYYFDYKDSVLPFKLTAEELQCAICFTIFPYFHALNKHMNEHFSNYVCETCGLGFVDKGRFVMHQQRHEEGDFPCEQCGKVFKAGYNRDLHVDRVHKKRGRVYCPKCDVKLMSYPQKLKHLVEVHGEAPLSFPCNMCDRVCETRRTLTIHRRKDHLKDYRYECQCCGQKFFTRFALNNHMPTHTGERNFKCKVCEKSYPRLKTLKDHMRIHTNDRRYRCHVCGQAFIQNCSLKGHMKSQHPEYG